MTDFEIIICTCVILFTSIFWLFFVTFGLPRLYDLLTDSNKRKVRKCDLKPILKDLDSINERLSCMDRSYYHFFNDFYNSNKEVDINE